MTQVPPFATAITLLAVNIAAPWSAAPFNGVDPFPRPPGTDEAALRQLTIYPNQTADSYAPNFGTPYNQQWTASIEHALSQNFMLSVNYVGLKGTHLYQSIDMNPATYIPGQSSLANVQQRRLYPYLGKVWQEGTNSYSNSNQLQVSLQKRYSRGYTILSSYTYGHTLGLNSGRDNEGGTGPRDPNNWNLNYGNLPSDLRHSWQTSFVWDIPAPQSTDSLSSELLGGWELGGIGLVHSGFPYTLSAQQDTSLTGIGGETADLVGDPSMPGNRAKSARIAEWFNTKAFAEPANGTFGTSGINQYRGPAFFNLDLGVYKNFRITESQRAQFRAEAFNIFNHANLGNPGTTVQTVSFGHITSAGDPRVIEFAVKYAF